MQTHSHSPKRIYATETHDLTCAIERLPYQEQPKKRNTQSHDSSSDYFQLIWIIQGEGDQWIDLEHRAIVPDQVLCLRPGQVHRFDSNSQLEGYSIRLGYKFLNRIEREINSLSLNDHLKLLTTGEGICIDANTKAVLIELVNQLQVLAASNELLKSELLKCYVEILILHLNHHWDGPVETQTKSRNLQLVESFQSLLDKNFTEVRMVAEYAEHLSVTPNYLNEIVKKITGFSAGYLIRQRIGLEAKRKVMHTEMCLKEIAVSLGFRDMAHFSKFFKKTIGKNFTDFRKEKLTVSFATKPSTIYG